MFNSDDNKQLSIIKCIEYFYDFLSYICKIIVTVYRKNTYTYNNTFTFRGNLIVQNNMSFFKSFKTK